MHEPVLVHFSTKKSRWESDNVESDISVHKQNRKLFKEEHLPAECVGRKSMKNFLRIGDYYQVHIRIHTLHIWRWRLAIPPYYTLMLPQISWLICKSSSLIDGQERGGIDVPAGLTWHRNPTKYLQGNEIWERSTAAATSTTRWG